MFQFFIEYPYKIDFECVVIYVHTYIYLMELLYFLGMVAENTISLVLYR